MTKTTDTSIIRTFPCENPSIRLDEIRLSPCKAVIGRGDRLVECGHQIAKRRTHGADVRVTCQGVGCGRTR